VAVYRDVTPEREAQAQSMEWDRLASMGVLAAGLAHEINNPLSAVICNLDLAWEELAAAAPSDESAAQRLEPLEEAREAARRMRDIVRDVRMFSRVEAEVLEAVDVRRVMDSSLRIAKNELHDRALVVRDYQESPPVLANESRLGQAFLNLVVNAAQAIAPGHACDNAIHVATRLDGDRVVVTISDTGSGMAPEVLERLFTPFFTTKPSGEGTGLGLAITQRIIHGLHGDIGVESEPGKGTAFRIALPLAPASSRQLQPESEPPEKAARRGRVLVVDDDRAIRRLVHRALRAEHDVFEADSGAAAMQRIADGERFDVILCDVMMPAMTGAELHHCLEEMAAEQAERMVFVSGGALTPATRAFLAPRQRRTLDKPFQPHELRRVIAAWLR
jgi:CheY-like chemotaxis protein